MQQARNKKAAARTSNARQDGTATRQHILQVAGQVFAELGFANATSKEICKRANTNVAAVNYHFGSKDELYYAVLVESHRKLGTIEDFTMLAELKMDARTKLEAIIGAGVHSLLNENSSSSWQLRVMVREFLLPSPLMDRMRQSEALPKLKIMREVFAEIMQLPVDHPSVLDGFMSAMAPNILMLIGFRGLMGQVFPDMDPDPERLRKHLTTFALAGLDAVAKQAREGLKTKPSGRKKTR